MDQHDDDNDTKRLFGLNREDLVARLQAAQASIQAFLKGFDALLHHGVNMKSLKEWQDTTLLEEAAKLKPRNALPKMIEWTSRLEKSIAASIKRKAFRDVNK